jgi:hypothetical protein
MKKYLRFTNTSLAPLVKKTLRQFFDPIRPFEGIIDDLLHSIKKTMVLQSQPETQLCYFLSKIPPRSVMPL